MPVLLQEEYSTCKVISKKLEPFIYQIEVWGADGGSFGDSVPGGKGGYSSGIIAILKNTQVYIHIGEKGSKERDSGGFTPYSCNGGGRGKYSSSGGGATDLRVGIDDLYHRIIVGGGGGGGSDQSNDIGGFGGGEIGGNGGSYHSGADYSPGKGASQTEETTLCSDGTSGCPKGTFGYGGNVTGNWAAGGGGGFYGGSASKLESGGGGGSGYVLSPTSPIPNGYFNNYRNYFFYNPIIKGGNEAFSRPTLNGNGYIRITPLFPVASCKCQTMRKSQLTFSLFVTMIFMLFSPIECFK